MAGDLGRLNIELGLNSAKFSNGLTQAERQASKFAAQTTRSLQQVENSLKRLENSLGRFKTIVAFGGIGFGSTKELLQTVGAYTEMSNKLRLVSASSEEAAQRLSSVFEIAQRTRSSVDGTATVYQKFAQNADALGLSQARVANLTETVSKAITLSGSSAASAQAAITQFGQALGSGVLRGDEFNSVMEQAPGLARAIAEGLGVTVGELRNLAKAGKLTTDTIIPALEKISGKVDADFNKMAATVDQAFENLRTSAIKWIGEADAAAGVSAKLADGILLLSQNFDTAAKVAIAFGGALGVGQLVNYGQAKLVAAANSVKHGLALRKEAVEVYNTAKATLAQAQANQAALVAEYKLAQSEQTRFALRERMKLQTQQIIALANEEALAKQNLARANSLATVAGNALKNAFNLIGGPAGAALIAGGAIAYFSQQAEASRAHALDASFANQQLANSYAELSEAALSLRIADQLREIQNYSKEVEKLKAGLATRNIDGLLPENEVERYKNQIQQVKENAETANKALDKMLGSLAQNMLKAGRSVDEIKAKFKALGADTSTTERVLDGISKNLDKVSDSTKTAENATLDLKKAQEKLAERSNDLRVKLEVLELKNKGHAKASYVLAGLYDLLGEKGAEYSKVLNAIANGDVAAAQSAAQAINLSVEQLQTMLDMGKQIEGLFDTETKTKTIETQIKERNKRGGGGGKSEHSRDSWLSFYDEIRKKASSTYGEISLEESRMFARLQEFMKRGVVSHQEYEAAKTAITERFAKQRLELAGRYAPEKLLGQNLKDEMAAIAELQKAGQLTAPEALRAQDQARLTYAQGMGQNAVSPLDQIRGQYDPNQDLQNRQAQELATLQAFYGNKVGLEEEFQQRKQQVIDKYKNEQFNQEMDQYAAGLNDLGGAFGNLASMVEQSAGKQSSAYKAMFAVSKAFAIAESMVKLSQAINQALGDPTALTKEQKFANMAAVASAGMNVVSQIRSIGFAGGGYTGDGGKYAPAGIVHRGEYVITKEATSRLGLGFLNSLNYGVPRRGFANGGGVGVPNVAFNGGGGGNVTVKVINNGAPMAANVESERDGNDWKITVELLEQMDKIADARYRRNQSTDMRAGGAFNRG